LSAEHVGWAFRQKGLTPTRKLVLVALSDRCNKDTLRCDPTIVTLMDDTGLSDRAVKQALADLCDLGLIARTRPRKPDGSYGHNRFSFPKLRVVVEKPPGASPALPEAPHAPDPEAPHAPKPEVDLEPEVLLAAAPRQRNEIWDALTTMFGEATTPSAQTKRGKVCRELRGANATHDEILARGKRWPLHFDNATLTETALVNHWDRLGRKPLRAGR
jgi:Helix-turn-helix domain